MSLVSGCTSKPDVVAPTATSPKIIKFSPSPEPTVTGDKIEFYHGRFSPDFGEFEARTGLPEGTVILSQLYRSYDHEEKLESWWPSDREFRVENGHIKIAVTYEKDGVPITLDKNSWYRLKIWSKDRPDITAYFGFDFEGPPKADWWWPW